MGFGGIVYKAYGLELAGEAFVCVVLAKVSGDEH
jgi:hypothetical protein